MVNNFKKFKTYFGLIVAAIVIFTSISGAFASEITPENIELLINSERTANGLIPLRIDKSLDQAAKNKSLDMVNRNYFEHYAFDLAPWDFIISAGYNYLYAGENLAMDFNTAEGTVNAWMKSPAHRDNILNPDYSDMGIGVVKGAYKDNNGSHDTYMVTNMFGRKKPVVLQIFDNIVSKIASFNIP